MKTIAVLLTVHNRKEKTLECLANLFSQQAVEGYQWNVFMTNDGCTDGTPESVKALYPNVNIVQGDGNLFWNRGMYKAWQAAAEAKDYDFYLWLNDDTQLNTNALAILLETSQKFEDNTIVVGSTSAVNNPACITYGGRNKQGKLLHPTDTPQACDYFNGNIVLFPRYVYKKVGMNDPVFHHALGDFDYGLRAAKLGVGMYVTSGILGECDAHESLATWCNPDKPFSKRWKAFRTPLGQNPEEFFVFEKRHNGISKAVFHYVTNYLRVIMPILWK
jgi:GT2 family glycosyltransferase